MEEKISKWILNGRFPKDLNEVERRAYGVFTYRRNKPIDDTDAVVLLPVLKQRYKNKFVKVMLESMSSYDDWFFTIGLMEDGADDYHWIESEKQPTIAQAITAAMMKLIESI